MWRLLVAFLLLHAFFSASGAQDRARLEGQVREAESGRPLAGATVLVLGTPWGSAADREGRYAIAGLPAGSYRVRFSFLGYASVEIPVQLAPGEVRRLDAELSSRAISAPEVVVTATRGRERESPITFSNLARQELEARTAVRDLPTVLSALPAVMMHSENGNGLGYNYLRIRGFDQRRISVLIDGVPQNDPEDHNVYWINFYDLAGSLEDVQVQRGGGAAFYGPPAIGGSINLVTRFFGGRPALSAELGYGSFRTQRYTLTGQTTWGGGRYALYGRFSHVRSDGYRQWSWTRFWRFFVGVAGYGERTTWKVQAFGGPQEDGLAFYGIPKAYNRDPQKRRTNYGAASRDREWFHQPQIMALHEWRLRPGLTLYNTAFYVSGDGYFDFDGSWGTKEYFRLQDRPDVREIPRDLIIRAYVDNDQVGWLPRMELTASWGRLVFGAELRGHESLHWGRIQAGTGLPPDVVGAADRRYYEYKGAKRILSVYASQLWRPVEALTLTGDLQLVWQQYRLYAEKYVGNDFRVPYRFANPKLGLHYNLSSQVSLYTSLAYTSREPRLKDIYDAEASSLGQQPHFARRPDGSLDFRRPLVKPERLLNWELGARYRQGALWLAANGYWMEFWDEIVKSGGLDLYGQPRMGNAERTRHLGLEVEGGLRLARGLDLLGNMSLSRHRFVRFTEYDDQAQPQKRDGNPIASAPERLANLTLRYQRGPWELELLARHVGPHHTDNSGSRDPARYVEAYAVADARLTYRLRWADRLSARLNLEVSNLTNRRYLTTGFGADNFFPAAPRAVYAGLKLEL
ncbi:MAG: TonB-dependent receptor [Bacteroidetes bacterium]|nr:TonB-dependent receptor [Rhodothermia bacterium]MCS7155051.1 TonB-dependent receptor [Bacteroidota bacterium]MCX7907335.1 TonB-dependent receptor [Bacteroidota bacterium]MDW8137938.1 TonB-dependent receptor [Bacteroidota bacterium]MDW8286210.1 TonB-dependent receptor [Bacteroidota bacterium]